MGAYNEDFSGGLPSNFAFDGEGYRINSEESPAGYTHSLQTRVITHRQSCEFSLALEFTEAGQFSFYRRVSSQSYGDYFYFFIDDVQKFRISGQGTWAKVTYDIPAGAHIFKWRYTKNFYGSSYSDCGFITGITAANVDTTNHYQTIKCVSECYDDFYAVRSEQVIRCIGSSVHSVYAARMVQAVKADVSCFVHPFLSGDGSLHSPFTLNKGRQLNEVRNFLSCHFKQAADVDMSDFTDWTPIGYEDETIYSFTGSYDGGDYKITGLKMEQPPFDFEWDDIPLGLFCELDTDYFLKNINLENVDFHGGGAAAGALAAHVSAGNIINCHSSGTITMEMGGGAGGLLGSVVPKRVPEVNITECSSSVNIEVIFVEWASSANYGGLIGMIELIPSDGTSAVNIIECFAAGDVRLRMIPENVTEYGYMENFGGLIGYVVELEEI